MIAQRPITRLTKDKFIVEPFDNFVDRVTKIANEIERDLSSYYTINNMSIQYVGNDKAVIIWDQIQEEKDV